MTPAEIYREQERRRLVERGADIAALLVAQTDCSHPIEHQREAGYYHSEFGRSQPPFAVCLNCGYSEEGWGAGYWKLSRKGRMRVELPQVSREELLKSALPRLNTQEAQHEARYGYKKQADQDDW